jgi:preprotein translocase subunit YajC
MSLINTAYAATTTGGAAHSSPSAAPMLIILAVIIVFYFWLWRNQSKKTKKHQDILGGLTKGDEVLTNGGIAGRVARIDDAFIGLQISKNTEITIQKPAIASVLPKGTIKHLD